MNLVYYYIIFVILLIIYVLMAKKVYSLEIGSNKNINVFVILLITIILLSLTAVQFNRIMTLKVNKIKPPIGSEGYRGIRGEKGDNASNCKCDTNICYKKVMEYITLVYNEWCSIKGYTQLAPTKYINNKFIKQKVKEMCESDTSPFHLLLERQGSNKFPYYYFVDGLGNQKPCNINNNCGAYDYMFAKWREWILIILKYERGKDFLDSNNLTDIDFNTVGLNGMITENDMKCDTADRYDGNWIFENPLLFPNIEIAYKYNENDNNYEDFFKEYLIKMDPNNGINRYNTYKNKKEKFKELDNSQKNDPTSLEKVRMAYKDYTTEISQYLVSLEYFTEYFNKNIAVKNIQKPFFNISNLKKSDFYIFYNIPGVPSATKNCKKTKSIQKILSPFDVIRQFDAWYWGAPKLSRPKLINSCSLTKKFIDYTNKPNIKIVISNNYKKIWDNSKIRQVLFKTHDMTNVIIPFQDIGRSLVNNDYNMLSSSDDYIGVDIYQAKNFTDVSEKELKFKYYYPVGQVVTPSNFIKKTDANNCHPKTASNRNISDILENGPSICTILVSGDVVEPLGYERLFIRKRTTGTMKNRIGYSIWRPIPPKGYVALGDIISVNIDGAPPSTNLIRCVPEYFVEPNFIYSDKTLTDIYTSNSKYNVVKNKPDYSDISIDVIEDTDYNPDLQNGNYKQINLVSNVNTANPTLDYQVVPPKKSTFDNDKCNNQTLKTIADSKGLLNIPVHDCISDMYELINSEINSNSKCDTEDIDRFCNTFNVQNKNISYSENYNVFRCIDTSDDNGFNTQNNIELAKPLFYKIDLDKLIELEKEETIFPYDKTEIINNIYDAKYSILNLYDNN